MTLQELVGQQIMIGVPGTRVTPEIIRIFQDTHAGGLIVFRPNFESAKFFQKFIEDLEKALGRRLLIAVDHEGGRVIHLREGITVFPDNWTLGNTSNADYAWRQGEIEARELRRLGIDVNLAPTLDVLTEAFSPNIGIRSYGKDPELVSKLGAARITAMQMHGLSACAKHFPGLGASPLDPHLDLPVLSADWKEMKKVHLRPFAAAIAAGVDSIMSSHPLYPNLDESKAPVTFSRKIIREYLREELQYDGLIFSDDLEMGALKNLCSIGESAVRAVAAGHDVVLVCHEEKAQREVFEALMKGYQSGRLEMRSLEQSAARVEILKRKRLKRFEAGPLTADSKGGKLAQNIAAEGVKIKGEFAAKEKTLIIFPQLSSLESKFHIEEEMLDENKFAEKTAKENGISVSKIKIVSIDPSNADIQAVVADVNSAEQVLFFCYDAHLSRNARKLLDIVQACGKAAVILLRDPFDEEWVKEGVPCAVAYGFRAVQINAAVKQLKKGQKALKV